MKLSTRNALKGTISSIYPGAVSASVVIELNDGQRIQSTMSMDALKELGLEVGQPAYAVINSSAVMVAIDD